MPQSLRSHTQIQDTMQDMAPRCERIPCDISIAGTMAASFSACNGQLLRRCCPSLSSRCVFHRSMSSALSGGQIEGQQLLQQTRLLFAEVARAGCQSCRTFVVRRATYCVPAQALSFARSTCLRHSLVLEQGTLRRCMTTRHPPLLRQGLSLPSMLHIVCDKHVEKKSTFGSELCSSRLLSASICATLACGCYYLQRSAASRIMSP